MARKRLKGNKDRIRMESEGGRWAEIASEIVCYINRLSNRWLKSLVFEAKLLRSVKAKGDRNSYAWAQLEHVRRLTEEQRVSLEGKVEAAQTQSAHILKEA